MSRYKAVIFDLDDTLYDFMSLHRKGILAMAQYGEKRFGIPAQSFVDGYFQADERIKKEIPNSAANHDRILIIQWMLESMGLPSLVEPLEFYKRYWDFLLTNMTLRDGAKELLERLKAEGVRMALCTDMPAHIQHRKLRALGIGSYFEYMVSCEEAQAEKPEPVMFRMTLEKLGLRPEECAFVGDNFRRDIAGSAPLGMDAVWVNTTGLPAPEAEFPFREIHSLREF